MSQYQRMNPAVPVPGEVGGMAALMNGHCWRKSGKPAYGNQYLHRGHLIGVRSSFNNSFIVAWVKPNGCLAGARLRGFSSSTKAQPLQQQLDTWAKTKGLRPIDRRISA